MSATHTPVVPSNAQAPATRGFLESLRVIFSSLANATVEGCATVETAARTANKTVGLIENGVDQASLSQRKDTLDLLAQVEALESTSTPPAS